MSDKKKKQIKSKTLFISLGIFLVILLIAVFVWVYVSGSETKVRAFGEKVYLPAAVISYTHFISMSEVADNLQSVKSFYENQDFSKIGYRVDFNTEKGKKNLKLKEKEILNKMVEDRVIEILAKKNGVNITKKLVDQNVSRKLKEYGTQEAVKENLKKQYGWTLEDFKEKVVTPSMYAEIFPVITWLPFLVPLRLMV